MKGPLPVARCCCSPWAKVAAAIGWDACGDRWWQALAYTCYRYVHGMLEGKDPGSPGVISLIVEQVPAGSSCYLPSSSCRVNSAAAPPTCGAANQPAAAPHRTHIPRCSTSQVFPSRLPCFCCCDSVSISQSQARNQHSSGSRNSRNTYVTNSHAAVAIVATPMSPTLMRQLQYSHHPCHQLSSSRG